MACSIPYIRNTNYSEAVKQKLEAEHNAIFDKLKASGEFRYQTNAKNKKFLPIADPSKYSNVRNVQLGVIADINNSYKPITSQNVVRVGKIASGRNVVEVDVLSLANYFDRTSDPVKRAVYEPIFKRGENQYEANGEIFNSAEEAINEILEDNPDSPYEDRTTGDLYQFINPEQTALLHTLNKLKERTGIPFITVNDNTLGYKGRFTTVNGVPTAEINIAHASSKTPVHEYLHPFIIAVRQENPSMYASLSNEIMQNHQDILAKVKELGYPEEFAIEEAIVRVLTDYAANPQLERPSVIAEFFMWLQDFISYVTGVKVTNLGEDLNLRKLAAEFMLSDDLYSKLESVRRMKSIDEFFEVTDNQFENITQTPQFKSIIDASLAKIESFKRLISSKPNLFSGKYKNELGELERQLKTFKEGSEGNTSSAAAIKASLNYVKRASENIARIKTQFVDEGGIYDQIQEALKNGEDLNPYLKELEAARNYFHLYTNFSELEDLLNLESRAEVDEYTNSGEIKNYLRNLVDRLGKDRKYQKSLSANQFLYFEQLRDLVGTLDSGPLTINKVGKLRNLAGWIKDGGKYRKEFSALTDLRKFRARKDAFNAIKDVSSGIKEVRREFNKNYYDIVTEILWRAAPKNPILVRGNEELPLTKELLRTNLQIADQDTGTLDTWLSATISSSDPVTAIAARLFKGVIYSSNEAVNAERYNLQQLYSKANPTNIPSADFHRQKGYIGEMQVLKLVDGELVEAQAGEPYYESPVDGKRYLVENRKRLVTQNRDDVRLMDEMLLRQELGELLDREPMFVSLLERIGSGQYLTQAERARLGEYQLSSLAQTIDSLLTKDYQDSSYSNLVNDEYYQALLDLYDRSNQMVSQDRRRLLAGELPQMQSDTSFREKLGISYRSFQDEVMNGTEGTWLGRFFEWLFKRFEADQFMDEEGGTTRERQYLDGQTVYDIPIKYTTRINPANIEEDLLSSILNYYHATNTYKAYSDLEPTVNALKTILRGDPDMEVLARSAYKTKGDEKQYNSKVKQFLVKKMNLNVNARLEEFVNDVLFGEDNLDDYQFKVGEKKYSVSKISNGLLGFSSLQNIAFNWIAGVSNALTGNVNNMSLAVGGKYFTAKDFWSANQYYWGNIREMLNDFSIDDINQKSKAAQLVIALDAIQGEWFGLDGKKLNHTQAQRLLASNALYFNQNATEHEVQVKGMIALMKATKVNGKPMWDLVNKSESGKIVWDPSVSSSDIESLKHKLHALSKQLHGNYNKFDKAALQRRWYGRLALMFRKYLYTSFRSRFGAKKYDYELEDITKGYYREAGAIGLSFIRKLGKDIKDWETLAANYDSLNEDGKAAIRRTTFELSVVVGAMLLGKAIAAIELDDDDEFLTAIRDNTQLQMLRLSRDFMVYVPFQSAEEFINVAKSPSLVIPVASKMIRFFNQLLPWNISEEFEKKTGSYNKGDNKALAYGIRTVPILKQMISLANSDEQVKYYTMLNKNAD